MNYRFNGKQKTLALGIYPAVSLAQARTRRDEARKLLALIPPIDPSQAKREEKLARITAAEKTFEVVARQWHPLVEIDLAKEGSLRTLRKSLRYAARHKQPVVVKDGYRIIGYLTSAPHNFPPTSVRESFSSARRR